MSDSESSEPERKKKSKKVTKKVGKKKTKPAILNPGFEDDERSLGMITFWNMHMFLKDTTESEVNDESGSGYVEGILKQTIGPVKAGTEVQLSNYGDSISINVRAEDEEDFDWEEVYKFRIILQTPVIVE